jgi:hypothetical protein
MGKQYLGLPSWQKTTASNRIISGILSNIQYQKDNLSKYVETYNPNVVHGHKRSLLLSAVPEDKWPELNALIDMYEQTIVDFSLAHWYVARVITTAMNLDIAKEAIPDCYWKHLYGVNFQGENTMKELHNAKCYSILEQIQINNLLLGITET